MIPGENGPSIVADDGERVIGDGETGLEIEADDVVELIGERSLGIVPWKYACNFLRASSSGFRLVLFLENSKTGLLSLRFIGILGFGII